MSNKMTAQELIYKSMIECAREIDDKLASVVYEFGSHDSFEDLWCMLKKQHDCCYDVEFELREGVDTNLAPTTSSRHYEIEVRATEIDGVWVAWDFYYGGGKHGEPEAFDWVSNARIVDCEERVVTKTEYIFKECT